MAATSTGRGTCGPPSGASSTTWGSASRCVTRASSMGTVPRRRFRRSCGRCCSRQGSPATSWSTPDQRHPPPSVVWLDDVVVLDEVVVELVLLDEVVVELVLLDDVLLVVLLLVEVLVLVLVVVPSTGSQASPIPSASTSC